MDDLDLTSQTDGPVISGDLTAEELELLRQYTAATKRQRFNKINTYRPYPWQMEFHNSGVDHTERMLMAANRVGKTFSGGAEVAYHMTGEYPDWWEGRKFDHPVLVWTGSPTNETSRDIVQNELLGGLGEDLGTGAIPAHRLIGKPTTRQAGVKNVVDSFQVRHVSGGLSTCFLKTYEQGWKKWQGTAPHVVWCDEEPDDMMIFTEAQTRVLTVRGIILVTFTPLSGVTRLVEHFQEGKRGTYLRNATWDDAPHLDDDAKSELLDRYPDYQRDARSKGIPMLGKGAVFPIPEEQIKIAPFPIPEHYARIKGIDFGIDHPAAGVELAWDRDQDCVYVIDCYKKKGEIAPYHVAWLNKNHMTKWVPVAWPHDGMNKEKGGGNQLHMVYRHHGANLLAKSARYPKAVGDKDEKGGAQPVEPVIMEVLDRMQTGRFKVFSNLSDWFEEYRSYHRKESKDGSVQIVNYRDDILKATFYAIMMKRYAMIRPSFGTHRSQAPTITTRI